MIHDCCERCYWTQTTKASLMALPCSLVFLSLIKQDSASLCVSFSSYLWSQSDASLKFAELLITLSVCTELYLCKMKMFRVPTMCHFYFSKEVVSFTYTSPACYKYCLVALSHLTI